MFLKINKVKKNYSIRGKIPERKSIKPIQIRVASVVAPYYRIYQARMAPSNHMTMTVT